MIAQEVTTASIRMQPLFSDAWAEPLCLVGIMTAAAVTFSIYMKCLVRNKRDIMEAEVRLKEAEFDLKTAREFTKQAELDFKQSELDLKAAEMEYREGDPPVKDPVDLGENR